MSRKRITILGATGSIGTSALDIVRQHPDRFEVVGLAAGANDAALADLVATHGPRHVALADPEAAARLASKAPAGVTVHSGADGVDAVAAQPVDLVICGIVGAAGLTSTFAAVRAGNAIALANKESMITAGALLVAEVEKHHIEILPIDSEHSAIFQCLHGQPHSALDHIILTASGGPFRTTDKASLAAVTPEQAARHPNWDMGAKITVDSATMMNKGLEVIEACWLFDLPPEQVRVVVHPQSIIHSMVAYRDGSIIAQLGVPDMRPPIAYAMAYPERIDVGVPFPDFAQLGQLTFEAPDTDRFPCLAHAFTAAAARHTTLPTVLNAANEVAVAQFLAGKVGFLDIPRLVGAAMAAHDIQPLTELAQVFSADTWARTWTTEQAEQRPRPSAQTAAYAAQNPGTSSG